MSFDPDIYTITIRKEAVDGEVYYVGRVAEFSNVTAYEHSYDEALLVIRNSLCEIARRASETGRQLPTPIIECASEPSGRLTLRMPKSLHARLNAQAQIDEMSSNQLVNLAITEYLTGTDIAHVVTAKITDALDTGISELRSMHAAYSSVMFNKASQSFRQSSTYSQIVPWQPQGEHITTDFLERMQ